MNLFRKNKLNWEVICIIFYLVFIRVGIGDIKGEIVFEFEDIIVF